MGVMTISMDNALEKQLRKKAFQLYGHRKGALGQALKVAVTAWVESEKERAAREKLLSLLEKGFDLRFKGISREEIYKDRMSHVLGRPSK
ncbi:MAG TPA: hypothetical protein VJI67_00735 [archaeon]|nr:hypothetical protein [archaeon]